MSRSIRTLALTAGLSTLLVLSACGKKGTAAGGGAGGGGGGGALDVDLDAKAQDAASSVNESNADQVLKDLEKELDSGN